jgi:hypothetical protein
MRMISVALMAAMLATPGIGCRSIDRLALPAIKATWEQIRVEYGTYVQKDQALSNESKIVRMATVRRMDELFSELEKAKR